MEAHLNQNNQNIQKTKNKEESIYQFCYDDHNPFSLTITKKPSTIHQSLFQHGVWAADDIHTLQHRQFQNKKYYTTTEFVNFISLDKQKLDSNLLVQTMLAMINQQTNRKQIMQKFKQLAYFCFGKQHQPDIQQFIQSYEEDGYLKDNQAVHWFARQKFINHLVNRMLRICKDPTSLFIIQPYFQDLFENVKNLYYQQQNKGTQIISQNHIKEYKKFTSQRTTLISDKQIKFFKQGQGLMIQNLGFFSTSRNENEADKMEKNALFVIKVEDDQRKQQLDYGFAHVHEYNPQHEDIILFNPLNSFLVVDFEEYQENKYKITLKYGEIARLSEIQNNKLSEKQLNYKWVGEQQIIGSQINTNIGHVLIQAGQILQGSSQYCDKFMEIANNSGNQITIADGHYLRGILAQRNGDLKTLEIQFTKCLEINETILNNDKDNKEIRKKITKTLNNLGSSFYNSGQFQKAVENYQKCEKIQSQTIGQNHPNYAITLSNLGSTFNKKGQHQMAMKYFQKCEQIERKTLGEKHPNYTKTLSHIGSTLNKMGEHKEAIQYYLRCEKIERQTLGENHPNYAATLCNLGSTFNKIHQYEKAVDYLQRCQNIERQILGENHPSYAITLSNLGSTFSKMGQYQDAIKYYQRCQRIQRQTIGENHQSYATTLSNLGSAYKKTRKYSKSIEYYERCERIQKQKLGLNHPDYARTLNNLGICFKKLGHYQKAVQYLESCLKIWKEIVGENHPFYVTAMNSLNFVFSRMTKFKQQNKPEVQLDANRVSQIMSQMFSQNKPKNKQDDIMIEVKKNNQQEVKNEEITIYYYIDICKQSVNQISEIATRQLFEFDMYNQVLSSIENADLEAAVTALQIIKDMQRDCEQLQKQRLIQVIDLLNCLFMIMFDIYDIYDPEKPNFSQKFQQVYNQLKQFLKKIHEQKTGQRQLSREIQSNQEQENNPENATLNNQENIMIKNEKSEQREQNQEKQEEEISLYYYIDKCKESISSISQIVTNQLFEFQLYDQVISYIEDVNMQAAVTAMQIIIDLQKECLELVTEDNIIKRQALDELNNLFMILLDIYDPEKPNFSERFKSSHMKLKELLKKR